MKYSAQEIRDLVVSKMHRDELREIASPLIAVDMAQEIVSIDLAAFREKAGETNLPHEVTDLSSRLRYAMKDAGLERRVIEHPTHPGSTMICQDSWAFPESWLVEKVETVTTLAKVTKAIKGADVEPSPLWDSAQQVGRTLELRFTATTDAADKNRVASQVEILKAHGFRVEVVMEGHYDSQSFFSNIVAGYSVMPPNEGMAPAESVCELLRRYVHNCRWWVHGIEEHGYWLFNYGHGYKRMQAEQENLEALGFTLDWDEDETGMPYVMIYPPAGVVKAVA
ncbi:hypothetical protein CKALI_06475 [Corynebacterium kalinowskii]|uniref:Uncharacterized protein n=1 Tax=Corynebacterium kalinowskii TaxID=2675216 RepID=A0A6B8VL42_9CORY|nr:hypothetical protein [Corynebacterium kalinowskii]QGU02164.1 hypothetical protein CKALI_06475 [Corynebacterium kalinowskii]